MKERDRREYGLSAADRVFELERKLGSVGSAEALKALRGASNPTDQILGAIVFLTRNGHPEDVSRLVVLANEDTAGLLRAAVVKDERG